MTKHHSESRTEDVVMDLLDIQGWPLDRPPRGCIIIKNEYKSFREFDEILKGRSKTGSGDAYPDFLVVSPKTNRPLMVIETKADDFEKANKEACFDYGEAFREAGHQIIAIGVAGQEKQQYVSVFQNFITEDGSVYAMGPLPFRGYQPSMMRRNLYHHVN